MLHSPPPFPRPPTLIELTAHRAPTGSSGGFSTCLIKSILARGDRVIATARSLDKMPPDLPQTDDLRLLQLDAATRQAVGFWGRIDVLVNNAGYGAKGVLEEAGCVICVVSADETATNVFGALDMTTAVLPYIRKEKSRTIVMMGSRTSWRPENTVCRSYAHWRFLNFFNHFGFTQCSGVYASAKAALRVFSETLASEPAAFRTGALINNPMYTDNPLPTYDAMRAAAIERYKRIQENLTGDPAKAMQAVVDVVRGEGKAAGRPWPLYLVLGDVGMSGVTEKCDTIKNVVERWRDVSTGLDFDPEELALRT
ncbi:hypothetical protein DFH08DRAFT_953052 [Mycena albidolilacea]|uniref:NAD(P)-binding protein n=1 Tax=Mycena albidolilacea TaxID=1033008 RepID=A0AAD7AJ34_9AGAR|nr:hypothetical protein DFH08DRAFT_953052 [Mycena albidolilacea]